MAARKVCGYIRKLCSQYWRVLRHPVVDEESIQVTIFYSSPIYVVFSHDAGGGASLFCERHIATLKETTHILLVQYLIHAQRYTITFIHANIRRVFIVQSFSTLMRLLQRLTLQHIFINNLVTYPKPLRLLQGISRLHDPGVTLHIFIHDYFSVCPIYTLTDKNFVFCSVPQDMALCQRCLSEQPRGLALVAKITTWREAWGHFLASADQVTVPDGSVKELLLRAYPHMDQRVCVEPHAPVCAWAILPPAPWDGPPTVGVIGGISHSKGALMLKEIAMRAELRASALRFVVIGTLDVHVPAKNVLVTGTYRHETLPELLKKYGVTLCLLPSVSPETFSYVAQEIEMLGLPLVCFDLGAPARRARNYANGYVVPTVDADACLDVLIQVAHSRHDYREAMS